MDEREDHEERLISMLDDAIGAVEDGRVVAGITFMRDAADIWHMGLCGEVSSEEIMDLANHMTRLSIMMGYEIEETH